MVITQENIVLLAKVNSIFSRTKQHFELHAYCMEETIDGPKIELNYSQKFNRMASDENLVGNGPIDKEVVFASSPKRRSSRITSNSSRINSFALIRPNYDILDRDC